MIATKAQIFNSCTRFKKQRQVLLPDLIVGVLISLFVGFSSGMLLAIYLFERIGQ